MKIQAYEGEVRNLPPINYHVCKACNFKCRGCHSGFQEVKTGHLPFDQMLRLVMLLAARTKKLNFAGGEPSMYPWFWLLVKSAKEGGATTSLTTNGFYLRNPETRQLLRGWLDWVALSIDSFDDETNRLIGRRQNDGSSLSRSDYIELPHALRQDGMRVKVNTVITASNFQENMIEAIRLIKPERWKLLELMRVEGENGHVFDDLTAGRAGYLAFAAHHRVLTTEGVEVVEETNDLMRGSYLMVDPEGRFFDSVSGGHRYSSPILEVGIDEALRQIRFDPAKFQARQGDWQWK